MKSVAREDGIFLACSLTCTLLWNIKRCNMSQSGTGGVNLFSVILEMDLKADARN